MPHSGSSPTRWPKASTTARGLGAPHRALRASLLPAAIGTPCPGPWQGRRSPRCTRIMVNPGLMDLDDRVPRYLGGRSYVDGARICCLRCNRSAGGRQGAIITNANRRRARLPTW